MGADPAYRTALPPAPGREHALPMEALLTTIGLGIVIALALAALARSWPRSPRAGGYHTWTGEERPRGRADLAGGGEVPRQDDDIRWPPDQ